MVGLAGGLRTLGAWAFRALPSPGACGVRMSLEGSKAPQAAQGWVSAGCTYVLSCLAPRYPLDGEWPCATTGCRYGGGTAFGDIRRLGAWNISTSGFG